MSEFLYRKIMIAGTTVLALGGAAACSGQSQESGQDKGSVTVGNSPNGQPYPWPYCDNAPGHLATAVGQTPEGPVVVVDSNCTDPADVYTGVYEASGAASQENGVAAGRLRNGSKVSVLCYRKGQFITNDKASNPNDSAHGSAVWLDVQPFSGQEVIQGGQPAVTTGVERWTLPDTHLAFFDPRTAGVLACK